MYANNPSNVGWGHPKSLLDNQFVPKVSSCFSERHYLKAIRQKAIEKKKKTPDAFSGLCWLMCTCTLMCVCITHITHTHTHASWANMHISKQANFRKIFYSLTIKRITDEHDNEMP